MNAPLLKGCSWTTRWTMLGAWRVLHPSQTRRLKTSRLYAKKGTTRRAKMTRTEAPSEIREISGGQDEPPVVVDEVTAPKEEETEVLLSVDPTVEAKKEENEVLSMDPMVEAKEEENEVLSMDPMVEAKEEENEIGVVNSVAPVVEEESSSFEETPPVDEHVVSVFHETVDPMPLHARILSSMDWGVAGMGTGIAAAILGALFVGRSFARGDSSRSTFAATIQKVALLWMSIAAAEVFCSGSEVLQAAERGRSSIEWIYDHHSTSTEGQSLCQGLQEISGSPSHV